MINWLQAWYILHFVAADRREKCPACGIRQHHPMKYDTDSKKILHQCRTLHALENQSIGCGAIWGIDCLVNPANWEVIIQQQNDKGNIEVSQPDKKFVEVTREPVIIKPTEKTVA